jgi:F420-dependent oxidoreductase-like protein
MELSITVEGQRGLNWTRWKRLVTAVESLGFHGLFRSDHFVDDVPPDQDSLDLWISLTWLAANTTRISFGSLVTPVSFRHPVHIARMARDLDDLSEGRLVLGVGAGWGGAIREHEMFGFELLDLAERFVRFEEGLEVITQLLRKSEPVDYSGQYYKLDQAQLIPAPQRPKGPPILIGGNGPKKVLPLVAKFADEWNAIYRTPAQFAALNERLNSLLEESGRELDSVKRSQMKGLVYGKGDVDLARKLGGRSMDELNSQGLLVGVPSQIVDQLNTLSKVGVDQVMVQWQDLDDVDLLAHFSQNVLEKI